MKKSLVAIGVFFIVIAGIKAQSDEDALRYSILYTGSTARTLGVGGAFGAVGADFGAITINPAGLGLYRSSDVMITPALTGIDVKSTFLGNTNDGQRYNFNLSNFGFEFNSSLNKKNKDSKWKSLNFAFGANRLANYNANWYYNGYNANNSQVDYWLEQVNNGSGTSSSELTNTYPFSAAYAWEGYLINPSDSNYYVSVIPNGGVTQQRSVTENGSLTEYLLSIAGNYNDKLFLGASVGLPALHYSFSSVYEESDDNNAIPGFLNYVLNEDLSQDGIGINGKFGLIYKAADFIRIGGAIHTPTFYSMSNDYSGNISTNLETASYNYQSPISQNNYYLITPWSVVGSLALIAKSYGFLSMDYEWLDYRESSYSSNKYHTIDDKNYEATLNQTIDYKYKAASNIRVGAEGVYDVFRFRAGVAFSGSPFADGIATAGYDYSSVAYSGGIGIRTNSFYIDAAYQHTVSKQYYQPYSLTYEDVPGAGQNKNTGNVLLTLGWKF